MSSPSHYDVEYRSCADDAWYTVSTLIDGEKLTVKYLNFSADYDNVFEAENFGSVDEIKELEERFRPVSAQLQDRECKNVTPGTVVCASHSFNEFDIRFYDAVVDDVVYKDHCFDGGEEQCMCTFIVVWRHGPFEGCLANKRVENICVVQSNPQLDPKVAIFSMIVRERLEAIADLKAPLLSSPSLPVKPNSNLALQLTQETECASRFMSNVWASEESKRIFSHSQRVKEEIDIGGVNDHYVVLIDNLDKDLLPSAIVEFIHQQTKVSVKAYVFPSLSSEVYTNGAIVLDCKKNLLKICQFLDRPNHIIISQRGRPCVITEKLYGHDAYVASLGTSMPQCQSKFEHRNIGISNALKVVCCGSEEYKAAKQLRDMFIEFSEHQQRLHKKLALEEQKILQASILEL